MSDHPWEVQDLGSGSFGMVKLFVNKQTGSKIALKQMKHDALWRLPPRERQTMENRMMQEIEIMSRLQHPNVIKAHTKPEDLVYESPGYTLHVWMEFCEGGDLRNGVLRNPDNCCGVPECEIRRICQDVNSGLKFLHREQIIHRDLKPENILLKEGHHRIIYKLTDFGYAKTYTQCSKANSFVGTAQYVAPEVVMGSHEHGRAVDFWSFATVVFELISLQRPFLHDARDMLGPQTEIQKKADDCIHIYWVGNSPEPTQSNSLPSPHQLCSPLQEELTHWLRMALQTNPVKRGGEKDKSSGDAVCLMKMDLILRTKVLNIVCMASGSVASFKLLDNSKWSDLTQWIQETLSVDQASQFLVSPDGKMHRPHSGCDHPPPICNMEDNCGILYLFADGQEPSFKLVRDVCPAVNELIQNQDDGLNDYDKPKVYAQTFFELREQYRLFQRLHCGHGAILHEIESLCKQVRDIVQDRVLEQQCHLAASVVDYMVKVHKSDLQQLEQLQLSKPDHLPAASVRNPLPHWHTSVDELLETLKNLQDVKKNLDQARSVLMIAQEMQSTYVSNKQRFDEFNENYVQKARAIYTTSQWYTPFQSTSSTQQDPKERMCDLYLAATDDAGKIIVDCLNGKNYLGVLFQLEHVSNELKSKYTAVPKLLKECEEKCERMRKDLWSLVLHPPTLLSFQSKTSTESSMDIGSIRSSASIPAGVRTQRGMSMSSVASSSAHEILMRLKSQASVNESFDGDSDSAGELVKSLKEQVQVMVTENAKEVRQNEEVLQRMRSVLSDEDEESAKKKSQGKQEKEQMNGFHFPTVDPEQSLFTSDLTLGSNTSTLTGRSHSDQH